MASAGFDENAPVFVEMNDNPLGNQNLGFQTSQSKSRTRFSVTTPTFSRLSRPCILFDSPLAEENDFKIHYANNAIVEEKENSPEFVVKKVIEPKAAYASYYNERKRKRHDAIENFTLASNCEKTRKCSTSRQQDSISQNVSKQTSPNKLRQLTPDLGPQSKRVRHVLRNNEMNMQKTSFKSSGKCRTNNNVKCTIPKSFVFETEARAALAVRKIPREEKYVFHAQEISQNVLECTVGVREKVPLKLTQPISPAFALKKRSSEWRKFDRNAPKDDNSSATDLKHSGNSIRNKSSASKIQGTVNTCTNIQPFSFDGRDKAMLDAKATKLQKAREEKQQYQKTTFKARPIPGEIFSPVLLSPRLIKTTVPEPFNFRLCDKKASKQSETVFKFNGEPTSVTKSLRKIDRSMAVRKTPIMFTERRAIEKNKKRELQLEQDLQQREIVQHHKNEEEKQKLEELRKCRENLVHKAKPVMTGHVMDIKPSEKKLTVPHSPNFATNLRIQHK